MLQFLRRVLYSDRRLQEMLATLAIAAGSLLLLGGCLYRVTFLHGWTAGEALQALWPAYLAGALALVLGWLVEWRAD